MVLHRRVPGEQRSHRIGTSLATNVPGSFGFNSGTSLVGSTSAAASSSINNLGLVDILFLFCPFF